MTTSPHRPRLCEAAVCVAGSLLSIACAVAPRGEVPGQIAAAPSDAAALEQIAQQAVFLAVTLAPARPHAGQCVSNSVSEVPRVVAGDLLRLRVAALLPDGRAIDLTGAPNLRYSIDNDAAGIGPGGWIRFYPGAKRIRRVFVAISLGDTAYWSGTFAVISPGPVDLPEGVRSLIAREFPDLRIPDDSDITYEWLTYEGGDPFVRRGDFDGNGLEDVALVLLGGSDWKLVFFNQTSKGVFKNAYVEGGKHGPGTPMICPQQIIFLFESWSSHNIQVEIIGGDEFHIRWNGTEYIHDSIESGE